MNKIEPKAFASVNSLINQFNDLTLMLDNIRKEKSDIDIKLSQWYHYVEGIDIKHISESHNLIKEVKSILERRRDIKIEEIILRSTCDTLKININSVKHKIETSIKKDESIREEIKTRTVVKEYLNW